MALKVGLLSCAHLHAYGYASALQQHADVTLTGVYDPDPTRGQDAAQRLGTRYFADRQALLDHGLDAVVITSENALHHENTLAAAAAGTHILCEKPLASRRADALEMIRVCRERGVILQTAFPCRFSPPCARAREIVKAGQIGPLVGLKGTNHGNMVGGWFNDPELAGGGAVMDHTVHVVDLWRWITGHEVVRVSAEIATRIHPQETIDDVGLLTLDFDDGVFATLDASWSRLPAYPTWGDVTLEVVGTEGTITVDAFRQRVAVYNEQRGRPSWVCYAGNMDEGLVGDFLDAVRQRRAPSITGEDGLKALEVALGAYRSAALGHSVCIPDEL